MERAEGRQPGSTRNYGESDARLSRKVAPWNLRPPCKYIYRSVFICVDCDRHKQKQKKRKYCVMVMVKWPGEVRMSQSDGVYKAR